MFSPIEQFRDRLKVRPASATASLTRAGPDYRSLQTFSVATQVGSKRNSGSDVLPQSARGRNGEIWQPQRIRRLNTARVRRIAWLSLLTGALLPVQARSSPPDWSYHPVWTHCVQPLPLPSTATPLTPETPSPVVLPPAHWPESPQADDGGWQFKQPTIGTGRAEAYTDSRTAVRLAEQQQDSALATSTEPPPGFDNLPGVLQGLNYRINFGLEYRF